MKIVVADFNLKHFAGHMYEYDRAICAYARRAGHDVTLLGNRGVDSEIQSKIGAVPCFDYMLGLNFYPPKILERLGVDPLQWSYRNHNRIVVCELNNINSSVSLTPDTAVFFPTTDEYEILPIVKWLESLPPHTRPRVGMNFHFPICRDNGRPWHDFYQRGFSYLEKSPVRHLVRVFVQSEDLADEFSLYSDLPFHVLPSPLEPVLPFPDGPNPRIGPITITYLGDLRLNKGYTMLPALVDRFEEAIAQGKVRFEIQLNSARALPGEWQAKHVLSALKRREVVLHDGTLSRVDYEQMLARADIALLPYTLNAYHSMMSGVFVETVAYGKPSIVPRGTWMARKLKEYGAGPLFTPGDRQSLYEATAYAVDHFDELSAKAYEKVEIWREHHSAGNTVETIIRTFEGAGE